MNETTFENARVGDRVWSLPYGWGTVRRIEANLLQVEFSLSTWWYRLSGACSENYPQTLFWDEIKFEAPSRPKRMVKKVVEGWVNVQRPHSERAWPCAIINGALFNDAREAISKRITGHNYLGEPFFIHHEYEVEE